MTAVKERLTQVDGQISAAVAAVEGDAGASPVLGAVVRELQAKSRKALSTVDGADEAGVRVAVAEVEQAADSAKAAAEADPGASDQARQAVLDAHQTICVLNGKLAS